MVSLAPFLRRCLSGGIPRRSLAVAAVVGTILNLINQGAAMLGHGHLDIGRMLLNYAVPYCVATYGAVAMRQVGTGSSGSLPGRERER